MDLSAEKAWNAHEHRDKELEKLLPLVRIEATIRVDLFAGGRIHRVIAESGVPLTLSFLRGLGESLSDEEVYRFLPSFQDIMKAKRARNSNFSFSIMSPHSDYLD